MESPNTRLFGNTILILASESSPFCAHSGMSKQIQPKLHLVNPACFVENFTLPLNNMHLLLEWDRLWYCTGLFCVCSTSSVVMLLL